MRENSDLALNASGGCSEFLRIRLPQHTNPAATVIDRLVLSETLECDLNTGTLNNCFLERLQESGLVSDLAVSHVLACRGLTAATDLEIARAVVNAQLLTVFQAKAILRARSRGLRIGDYHILYGICHGGMGEIYVARGRTSGLLCAVKFLRPHLRNNPRSMRRFELEAEALSKIHSSNVLAFIDAGWVEGARRPFSYLVTELVQGPNLHELLLLRGCVPWQQACDMICQVADGLDCAHRAGFIHRDIKPTNVLIAPTGQVKVIDFGLALYAGSSERFLPLVDANRRCMLGTQRFSAPEQFGCPDTVDVRADVFGLGATLLFALTAKVFPEKMPEFPADFAVNLLRATRADVPRQVEVQLQRMLDREPANRFASITEAVAGLRSLAIRFPVEINFESILRMRSKLGRPDARGVAPCNASVGTRPQTEAATPTVESQTASRVPIPTTKKSPLD